MTHYEQAWQDLKLNSIPQRNQSGEYSWNQGLLKIMSLSKFEKLKVLYFKMVHLQEYKTELTRKILNCKEPADSLNKKTEETIMGLQDQLDGVEYELERKEEEKEQLLQDVYVRNGSLKDISDDKPTHTKKNYMIRFINWVKKVGRFLGIWILIELFMSGIQWISLREVRSIEEVIVRSLSIAMILLFFHLISELNERYNRPIYRAYQIFNILVIMAMMFAPPILYHMYPQDNIDTSSEVWSLNEDVSETTIENNTQPSFVRFYLNNEWIPAALSVVLFVWIYFGLPHKKKTDSPEQEERESSGIERDKFQSTKNRLNFLDEKISRLEDEKKEITKKIDENENNPIHFKHIRKKLEKLDSDYRKTEEEISKLKTEFDSLISKLKKELVKYKVEFEDVLNSDTIRRDVVKPEWPTRKDIIEYFQINPKLDSI